MQKKLNNLSTVAVEVMFQIRGGMISFLPDGLFVARLFRKPLAEENFRMHPDDHHFLIIGTIEDADAPTLGQATGRRQQTSCSSSSALGCLKLNT